MQKSVLFLCALVVLGLVGRSEGQPGSKIAFISGRGGDEHWGQNIQIMEADGSDPIQLIEEGAALVISEIESIGFAWSPDGTKIAFESFRDGPRAIWIAEADGSNSVNLTGNTNNACTHPSWSPDGTKIVFESSRDI
jgi:TolB protein